MIIASSKYESMFEAMEVALICEQRTKGLQFANKAAKMLFQLDEELSGPQYSAMLASAIKVDGRAYLEEGLHSFFQLHDLQSELPIIGLRSANHAEPKWFKILLSKQASEEDADGDQLLVALKAVDDLVQGQNEANYQQKLQSLLLRITQTYISIPIDQLNDTINDSLQELGEFIGADRLYIFDYVHEQEICRNTHEWCADDIEPQIDQLQETPYAFFPDWLEAHFAGKTMLIQDVSKLSETSALYEILVPQGIKSLIAVPLMDGPHCLGFIGIDAVKKLHIFTDSEQQLLQIFAKALVNVRKRFASEVAVLASEKLYRQMAENLADALWTSDKDFNMGYTSPAFARFLNHPKASFDRALLFESIQPENEDHWPAVLTQLSEDAKRGNYQQFACDARFFTSTGEYRWVHLTIKPNFTEDEEFSGFLGVIRDIHDRKQAELQLLDVQDQTIERFKELRCVYEATKLSQSDQLSLDAFLRQLVGLLPPAFHFPVDTAVKIQLEDNIHQSSPFFEIKNQLRQEILYAGAEIGEIVVFVRNADFLPEEVELLQAVSLIIAKFYEKHLNQRALQLSEEKYRIIADNTFNWEFWISPEAEFLYHSPACERISGYNAQEFMNNPDLLSSLVYEDDKEHCRLHMAELLRGEKVEALQFRIHHATGRMVYIELMGQAVYSESGDFLGVRGSLTDISARKVAELELQSNQEKLHKLLSTQTFYVIRTDLNGLHTYWNEKFEQDFGWIYQAKGMELSDSLSSICEYDRENAAQAAIECLSNPGKIIKVELDKPLRGGSIATTLWEFAALTDANGVPIGVQCMGLDITERRAAERELRSNAEYLTKLMATQTNYVIRTNLQGLHTYWNSKFEEDFGWMYKKRGMDQSDSLASICDYDKEKAEKAAFECLSSPGTIVKVELDKPSKNGGVMSTLWEFIALVDENGNPTGVQCMGLDITERKQAEIALKKSEEQYRGLIESSDAAISMLDEAGNYLYLNSIAARPFGISPDEAVGKSVYDFFEKHDAESIIRDVKRVIDSNEGVVLEPFLIIDGQKRWFRTSIQPIRDENGAAISVFMHASEITIQKESELRLKASELKYKTLFFDSPEAYLMLADGKFIECNRASELLIGADRSYLVGKSPVDISPAYQPNGRDSKSYADELLAEAYSKGKVTFEWEHYKADGGRFLAQVNLATIEYENREAIFISWQDITNQKAAEDGIKRFSQIIEQSPLSVVMTDLEGKLVYSNAFAAKASGYTREEIMGVGFEQFYPEHTIKAHFKDILSQLGDGKDWKGTLQGKKSDGSLRWENALFFPVADDSGVIKNYISIIEDITEKLAVEEALSLSEQRSAQIAEHSRTVIWEVNLDGLYTYISPVASQVFGRKSEDIVGKLHYYDLHPKAGREELIAMFEEAKKLQLTVMDLENQIELPDGQIIWVSTNATPYIDSDGQLLGYRGSDKDITAKKLADEELKKFRVISDQANYGTAIATLEGKLLYVNKAYAQMHGYEAADLVGTHVSSLHDQAELAHKNALLEEIRDAGGFTAKEVSRLRRDGTTFPALMSSAIIGEAGSEDSFLSATIIDITERKVMEQELLRLNATLEQRIEERTLELTRSNAELHLEIANRKRFESELQLKSSELQTFFDVALDLMCIADTQGNFVKLNKAWEHLLGYTLEELLSKKFLEFVHPDDLEETLQVMGRLQEQERVISFTNRYKTKEEEYRFIEWHSVPVGNLIYAAARDITDRIQQEEALKQARLAADEANHSKSEFLSRMSHELRTPLNSILGFAQLLAMGQLAESQQKSLNHILRSGKHLLDLINEVLDISRIEAGRISVSVEPVKVHGVLQETVDLLSPYALSRNIEVHLPKQDIKSLMVLADQQRLKQVFTNVLNNALKYNLDGGKVWIDAGLLPQEANGAQYVQISIKDTGIGIASEDLPKVFNPFERLSATDSQTEGTGLGLTVVKQLLELMGGIIEVESIQGKGSLFKIKLPHARSQYDKLAENAELLEQHGAAADQIEGCILYVEDNTSNLELVEQILAISKEKINLVHTAFGGMALAMAKEHRPNLILLDLNLPDIHGSEVIQQLKSDESTRDIPVIVVSADAMPNQVKELMRLGAMNYLTKPLDVQVFLTEVEKYLM